jgi:hypothetical protein
MRNSWTDINTGFLEQQQGETIVEYFEIVVDVASSLSPAKWHKLIDKSARIIGREIVFSVNCFQGIFLEKLCLDQTLTSQPVWDIGLEQRTWIPTVEMT